MVNDDLIEIYVKLGLGGLPDAERGPAIQAFCSLLDQLSEEQLLPLIDRPEISEEVRRQATAAILDDEMVLVSHGAESDMPASFPRPGPVGRGRPGRPILMIALTGIVLATGVVVAWFWVWPMLQRPGESGVTGSEARGEGSSAVTQANPGDSAVASPSPSISKLLYRADWSAGVNDWPRSEGWSASEGMYSNNGLLAAVPTIAIAPYEPPTANYAVEAEIQRTSGNAFGLVARVQRDRNLVLGNGYTAGVAAGTAGLFDGIPGRTTPLAPTPYEPGGGWHTYRLEVEQNTIRMFLDGALWTSTTDNTFASGWMNGVWSLDAKINVRSYSVLGP